MDFEVMRADLHEIEELAIGRRSGAADRVLATVLFTDSVVAELRRAFCRSHDAWRDLITRHHGGVRGELRRFGGNEIDTAGDPRT